MGENEIVGTYFYAGVATPKLFGIFPLITYKLRVDAVKLTTPAILDNIYDNAQGGVVGTQANIAENFPDIPLLSNGATHGRDFHTFTPTVSALDMRNQDYGLNNIWLSRRLLFNINAGSVIGGDILTISHPQSPFTTFASGGDASHPTYNVGFMRYIHRHITGTPNFILACFGLCQTNTNASVWGTAILCATTPQGSYLNNFAIANPATHFVQWVLSPNLRPVAGGVNNNQRIDVELINPNDPTPQSVRANLFNTVTNCVLLTNTFPVWVGEPRTLDLQTRVEGCYLVITPVSPGASLFDWELNNSNIAIGGYGANSIGIHYADWVALNLTEITVTCRAFNSCNPNTPLVKTETFSRPSFPRCVLRVGTPAPIKAYPNPTAGTAYITLPEGSGAVQAISVRNGIGVEVLNLQQPLTNEKNELILQLGNLPDGLYIVGLQNTDGSVQYVKVVVHKGGKAN